MLPSPGAESRTWPVYLPFARPCGAAVTVTSPLVVPPDGLTDSHDPPRASAVNGTGSAVELTPSDWLSVLLVCDVGCSVTVRALACRMFPAAAVTFSVTPTVCGLFPAPLEVIVTDPL